MTKPQKNFQRFEFNFSRQISVLFIFFFFSNSVLFKVTYAIFPQNNRRKNGFVTSKFRRRYKDSINSFLYFPISLNMPILPYFSVVWGRGKVRIHLITPQKNVSFIYLGHHSIKSPRTRSDKVSDMDFLFHLIEIVIGTKLAESK